MLKKLLTMDGENEGRNKFEPLKDNELNEFLFEVRGIEVKYNIIGVPIISQYGPKILYSRIVDSPEQYEKVINQYEADKALRLSKINPNKPDKV